MTLTSSDLTASSQDALHQARGQVIHDGRDQEFPSLGSGPSRVAPSAPSQLPVSSWVREAGDGLIARFVTRRSLDWSPLRAGLHALAHITR